MESITRNIKRCSFSVGVVFGRLTTYRKSGRLLILRVMAI